MGLQRVGYRAIHYQVFRPSGFCLLQALGCDLPLRLTKNIGIFRHALPSAHIWTKSSCGVDISYFEVFTCNYTELWPWQGSLCKNGEKSSNTLIQPYPNRLLSPCRSSTLLGCTGWQLRRYPPAAGSSGSTKMYSKESRHGKRGKAGQKEVMHQNQ